MVDEEPTAAGAEEPLAMVAEEPEAAEAEEPLPMVAEEPEAAEAEEPTAMVAEEPEAAEANGVRFGYRWRPLAIRISYWRAGNGRCSYGPLKRKGASAVGRLPCWIEGEEDSRPRVKRNKIVKMGKIETKTQARQRGQAIMAKLKLKGPRVEDDA